MNSPSFRWPDGKKAAVSITFDDGRESQLQNGIPVLNMYNIRGSFYPLRQNYLKNLPGWRKLSQEGHEIGCHTLSHPCSGNYAWSRDAALEDFSYEQICQDIDQSVNLLKADLGVTAKTFAYPCGQKFIGRGVKQRSYVPAVAERFIAGRGYRDSCHNAPDFCDLANIMSLTSDTVSFDYLIYNVEKAVEEHAWVVFTSHDVSDADHQAIRPEVLSQFCSYLQKNDSLLHIAPVVEVARTILRCRPIEQASESILVNR